MPRGKQTFGLPASAGSEVPVGSLVTSYAVNPPDNYLEASGAVIDRRKYPELAATLGARFNTPVKGSLVAGRPVPTGSGDRAASNGTLIVSFPKNLLTSRYQTSTDGHTWTERSFGLPIVGRDIAWNGAVFCIVGTQSRLWTSADGLVWTQTVLADGTGDLAAIAVRGSLFCAIGTGSATTDYGWTSTNGLTWTRQTIRTGNSTAQTLSVIAASSTAFVIIPPGDGTYADTLTSSDGVTWTFNADCLSYTGQTANATPTGIAAGGGYFVCWYGNGSGYNNTQLYYSTNGSSWSPVTLDGSNYVYVANALYNGSTWLLVEVQAYDDGTKVFTAATPSSWTKRTTFPIAKPYSCRIACAHGSTFIVGADSGTRGNANITTTDGVTWIQTYGIPIHLSTQDLAWSGALWVAVGYTIFSNPVAYCYTSPDGVTWTQRTLPSSQQWSYVAWNGSVFAAINSGGSAAAYSADGLTWTSASIGFSGCNHLRAINGTFFAFPGSGNTYYTSTNGATWTARTFGGSNPPVDLESNGSLYVGSDGTSTIYTSPDGLGSWTTAGITWNGGTGARFFYLAALKRLVAITSTFTLYSADGKNWTRTPVPSGWSSASWVPVFDGSNLLAGNGNQSLTSADGITWVLTTLPYYLVSRRLVSFGRRMFTLFNGDVAELIMPKADAQLALPSVAPTVPGTKLYLRAR